MAGKAKVVLTDYVWDSLDVEKKTLGALAETPILISAGTRPAGGNIGVAGRLEDIRPVRPAVSRLAHTRRPGLRVGTGDVGYSNVVFGHADERRGLAGRKARGERRPVRVPDIQSIDSE